ncbi:hypothetical protein ACLKA7_001445 [Drosophila subpalustris]
MGDLLNNLEMLKKLCFDSSNQWIIYDELFEKFFNFLSENITDLNILTVQELLERSEMQQRGEWFQEPERLLKIQQMESNNIGLLKYTSTDLDATIAEMEVIEDGTYDYSILLEDMQNTKHSLNNNLSDLDSASLSLHNVEMELITECQTKARQLEEVQRENCKLSEEANKGFTTQQVPPLFMHQLPLEQYFLKCDSFMQYFNLYMKDNFKILDFSDFDGSEGNMQNVNFKMEHLQKSIQYYTLAYMKEKAKVKATQAMIDHIILNQIHCISLVDMAREAHDLQILNENHLKNTYGTLLNALTLHVQQHIQQRIELVLYENTKQKLERALRRRASDKQLTSVISNTLSNAELIWIAIQLDLEKKRNCTDSSMNLCTQAHVCWQRVQLMRSLNTSPKDISEQFLHHLSSLLSAHLGQKVHPTEMKSCLYEYEKIGRLVAYAIQSMVNTKHSEDVHEQLADLKHLEQKLRPFVFDSPLEQPMFENVQYLCTMFKILQQQQCFEELLRSLRTQFSELIMERMDKEKLWRFSKLLWIWFLTEPQPPAKVIAEGVEPCGVDADQPMAF